MGYMTPFISISTDYTICTHPTFYNQNTLNCELEPCSWRGVLDTTLCDKVCHSLGTGWWVYPGTPVLYTYKSDCHDIFETLLKVTLNTINQINQDITGNIPVPTFT